MDIERTVEVSDDQKDDLGALVAAIGNAEEPESRIRAALDRFVADHGRRWPRFAQVDGGLGMALFNALFKPGMDASRLQLFSMLRRRGFRADFRLADGSSVYGRFWAKVPGTERFIVHDADRHYADFYESLFEAGVYPTGADVELLLGALQKTRASTYAARGYSSSAHEAADTILQNALAWVLYPGTLAPDELDDVADISLDDARPSVAWFVGQMLALADPKFADWADDAVPPALAERYSPVRTPKLVLLRAGVRAGMKLTPGRTAGIAHIVRMAIVETSLRRPLRIDEGALFELLTTARLVDAVDADTTRPVWAGWLRRYLGRVAIFPNPHSPHRLLRRSHSKSDILLRSGYKISAGAMREVLQGQWVRMALEPDGGYLTLDQTPPAKFAWLQGRPPYVAPFFPNQQVAQCLYDYLQHLYDDYAQTGHAIDPQLADWHAMVCADDMHLANGAWANESQHARAARDYLSGLFRYYVHDEGRDKGAFHEAAARRCERALRPFGPPGSLSRLRESADHIALFEVTQGDGYTTARSARPSRGGHWLLAEQERMLRQICDHPIFRLAEIEGKRPPDSAGPLCIAGIEMPDELTWVLVGR
jgi:hypothetical protein